MLKRRAMIVLGVLLAGLGGVVGGCASSSGPTDSLVEPNVGVWVNPGPFEATRLRVFPLTRVDVDQDGSPLIMLFLELTDQWGDSVKAVGDLTVRVWPSRSVGGGSEAETWEVSLWDAEANAGYFDPTSRTYRIPLTDLPAWITDKDGPSRDARVEIDVILRTPSSGGGQRSLRDSISVPRGG